MTPDLLRLVAPNHVSQIAFVVRDFEKSIQQWARVMGAGPFYCGDFKLENYTYRGQITSCDTTVGLGYLADMQIQIVTQRDDNPSIYKEILDRNPAGDAFHHLLTITEDMDGVLRDFRAKGVGLASYVEIKGMRVAFFDTVPMLGTLIEYFQRTAYHDEWFKEVHKAHLTWDGKDPIRRHPLG